MTYRTEISNTEQFCDRWLAKAETYDTKALEDLFDKFFTLYVTYNRIYSTSADLYRSMLDASLAKKAEGDRYEATTLMDKLIGQDQFDDAARSTVAIRAACRDIAELLEGAVFYLHTFRGTTEPDVKRDAAVARGLRETKLLSVLNCLYQIRCNTFHGGKDVVALQRRLLLPAILLLEAIVPLSRKAMREQLRRTAPPRPPFRFRALDR